MFLLTLVPSALVLLIIFGLYSKSKALLGLKSLGALLFSTAWSPLKGGFGLLPFILGTLWVTAVALVIAVPVSLFTAIYLSEYATKVFRDFAKPVIDLLAGIPSVVYGFMGIVLLVPFIRETFGGPGLSVLAASIILGIMILPTVISISVDALQAVPPAYREGSIALGATRWQTVKMVLFPAARSGIIASIILGMGRAVGETMATIMIAGNAAEVPRSLLAPVRTLTSNVALEMSYATGEHREALFATGVVLFVIIMVLNTIANATSAKRRKQL